MQVPSWRLDVEREIDLIEEVGRIYGYDHIPEDAGVKMVASTRSLLSWVASRAARVFGCSSAVPNTV